MNGRFSNLNVFLVLKIVNVGRFYKLIQTCRNFVILVICHSRSVKCTCIFNYTYIWSKRIHSWGPRVYWLGLGSIVSIIFKVVNERQTLSKIVFKTKYLENLLWIVWYYCMKICEWFLGVEYDVYHNVLYFLLYLNCEKLYGVVELYDIVDVD